MALALQTSVKAIKLRLLDTLVPNQRNVNVLPIEIQHLSSGHIKTS